VILSLEKFCTPSCIFSVVLLQKLSIWYFWNVFFINIIYSYSISFSTWLFLCLSTICWTVFSFLCDLKCHINYAKCIYLDSTSFLLIGLYSIIF
jgi:hypothetical protein